MAEKRRKRRVPRRVTVRFGEDDPTTAGVLLDLSADGAFIASPTLPPLGARIHVRFEPVGHHVVFLEARVRRHRARAANYTLQQLEPNGFGVSFVQPLEVVAELLGKRPANEPSPGSLVVSFDTPASLTERWHRELCFGGVFVPGEAHSPRDAQVVVALQLPFAERCLEVRGRVLQVLGGERPGLAVAFDDPGAVLACLRPYVEGPVPFPSPARVLGR